MQLLKQLITPEAAKSYLEKNTVNRRLNQANIAKFAREMLAGRWIEDTAEAIKISDTGLLIDGQNRLSAVVKTGLPIRFLVAFGVPHEAIQVIDTGARRTAADAFKISGIKNAALIPGIIATHMLLKQGGNGVSASLSDRPSITVLLNLYFEREGFWQAVSAKASSGYGAFGKILPPALIGGMYCLFSELSVDDAERFIDQLCTGKGVTCNAIALIRQKLINDRTAANKKMTSTFKSALIIKAWNCFRNGEDAKSLRFDPIREQFPTPI